MNGNEAEHPGDIRYCRVTADDLDISSDEVERGIFQQIDQRERRPANERSLLSVDEHGFQSLSSLYLPSPARGEESVGQKISGMAAAATGFVPSSLSLSGGSNHNNTASAAPAQASSALPAPNSRLQEIVRNKVLKKKVKEQKFLKESLADEPPPRLEWALNPESPRSTEQYLYATLQGESRRDVMRGSLKMVSSSSKSIFENEPDSSPTGHAQAPRAKNRRLSYFDVGGETDAVGTEQEPLISGNRDDGPSSPSSPNNYAATMSDGTNVITPSMASRFRRRQVRGWYGCCQRFGACLAVFFLSPLVGFSVLLFAAAWFLFHYTKDPKMDILNSLPLSWILNFCGRQCLTLQLAHWTQYVLIDGLILNFKPIASGLGPLITVWAIQARGFNFVLFAWGFIDSILLQGDNRFQLNWLYWTGLAIYNQSDIGALVLNSELYTRILISMILVGLACSIKRTWFGVSLDRKILRQFKPTLEKLVQDIVILSEVADLGAEAEKEAERDEEGSVKKEVGSIAAGLKPRGVMSAAAGGVSFKMDVDSNEALQDAESKRDDDSAAKEDTELQAMQQQILFESLQRSKTGTLLIRDRLDRWVPPENKAEKAQEASIKETLSFRRVLMIMDYSEPFGESFGPAVTRDDCIENSNRVYQQLLLLSSSEHGNLSFEIIALLARDANGNVNKGKLYQLRKVFRPDGKDELSMLAFVQSCDSVYRRFRYFRASVSNAAVLDNALENLFDYVFYGAIAVAIAAYLGLNPLPMLLSLSTLLVSFSFAMGSSAAAFVEGIFMILVRRPYDLGDRIMITGLSNLTQPDVQSSYFVSEISLFSTTLTHTTNQVSTVKNGALSNLRIINCNRSPGAIVVVVVSMSLAVLEDDLVDKLCEDVTSYCRKNPRSWDNLLQARIQEVSLIDERVEVKFQVRHRFSWQDSGRILRDRGAMYQFMYMSTKSRGCHYINVPRPQIFYNGGRLVDGSIGEKDTRTHLLTESNIVSADDSTNPIHPAVS